MALIRDQCHPLVSNHMCVLCGGSCQRVHDADLAVGRRDILEEASRMRLPHHILQERSKRRRRSVQVSGHQHDHAVGAQWHAHIISVVCRQQLREDHIATALEQEVMPTDLREGVVKSAP